MATAPVTLPSRAWVGNYEFTLEEVHPEDPRLEGCDGITLLDEEDRAIYINAALDRPKAVEIVLHELTHTIWFVYGIDELVAEEKAVTILAEGMARLLIDNPKFQRWLSASLNTIRKERSKA